MAAVPVKTYKQFWIDKRLSLNTQYKDLASTYPVAAPSIQQLLKVLCVSVGESKEWADVISLAEVNREDNCKVLKGKTLFSAVYGMYTVTLLVLYTPTYALAPYGQCLLYRHSHTRFVEQSCLPYIGW
jgi:hypothetical protein